MTNTNNLELNQGDDFIIALDVSASMQATDTPTGATRYDFSLEKTKLFIGEAGKYDTDGVSVYLFGQKLTTFKDVTAGAADKVPTAPVFEMATQTHLVINEAWNEHKAAANEQTTLMIVTDGVPSDKQAVKDAIVRIANEMKDEREFNIIFLTVGGDVGAAEYIQNLDDNLKEAKHDIVGSARLEDIEFVSAFAEAVEG